MLEHHSEKHNCHAAKFVDVDAEIDLIKKRLDKKANEDELQQTAEYVRTLPRNEELVELYKMTVPQMDIYQNIMNQYSRE